MKILIINFSDVGGGAEMFSKDLADSIPEASLLTREDLKPNKTWIDKILGKLFQKFSRFSDWRHFIGLHDSFHNTFKILKGCEQYLTADIVHINNIHGNWFDLKALAHIDKEKKIIWTLHDMWVMTGGEAYTFDNANYQLGNPKTPFIKNYPLRAPWVDNRKYYFNLKRRLYKTLLNTTLVPVSDWLSDCLNKAAIIPKNLDHVVIKNGVDSNVFNPNQRKQRSGLPRVLLFNSQNPYKGSEIAIRALADFEPSIELCVIGSPIPEFESVTYFGSSIVDRADLADIYRSVDILLFPSKAENMPLTVLEAMACGVCVIGSKIGGIPELIVHGKTGFLSEELTYKSFANTISLALESDIHGIGLKASLYIDRKHRWEDMVDKYRTLYKKVLHDTDEIAF